MKGPWYAMSAVFFMPFIFCQIWDRVQVCERDAVHPGLQHDQREPQGVQVNVAAKLDKSTNT